MVNEFCRECPKCCRVFEGDDDEQFQEENREKSSTSPPLTNFHLKNIFRKWNGTFTKCFLPARSLFWEMLLLNFRRKPASQ